MANTITMNASRANTTLPVEFLNPATNAWVDGVQQTDGTFRAVITGIPAGSYSNLKCRLKGSSPEIISTFAMTVTVLGTSTTTPAPTLTSFAPTSGAPSSQVVLTGTGFTGATQVSINSGAVAGFTVDSATQITATLTSAQATGKVRVTTPAGTAVSTGDFTVQAAAPNPGRAYIYTNGDSIMDGDTLLNRGAERMIQQLVPNVPAADFGGFNSIAVSGQSTQDMLNRIASVELPMLNALVPTDYPGGIICVFDGGENDMMYGATAAQVRANRTAYMSQVKAGITNGLPIKFIEVSMLPNGKVYGNTSLANYEIQRRNFNSDTFTNFQSYGAALYVNFNADSRLNNVNDTAFFAADMQHPSYAGHTAMMQEIQPYAVAAQRQQYLAPKADLGAIGSGSGNGSAPNLGNLTATPATPARKQNVSVTGTNTLSIAATVPPSGTTGFNAGAINRYGIGYQAGEQVLGFVSFKLYHADGEWAGGFNTSGRNAGSDYQEISYAFHLSAANGQGVRPFGLGTAATAGNNIGFTSFVDGDEALLVRYIDRVSWYIAGQQIFTTPNTDTSDWMIDFALKGQGSTMHNVTYGGVNLIDFGADPASTAVYDRVFSTLTPGQLADGWTVNGNTSAQTFNDGLYLNARFDFESVGINRPYLYQDGELTVKLGGSSPRIMMRFHQQSSGKCIGFWSEGNSYLHNAGVVQGSNVQTFKDVGVLNNSGVGGTHYMSMLMRGTVLELRIWADGGSRPAAAMYSVTITDPDLTGPGTAAIGTLDGQVVVLEAHLTDVV